MPAGKNIRKSAARINRIEALEMSQDKLFRLLEVFIPSFSNFFPFTQKTVGCVDAILMFTLITRGGGKLSHATQKLM